MIKLVAFLICLSTLSCFSKIYGQEITVLDQVTQKHIPSARIYSLHPKIDKLANAHGRFQLSLFEGCDSVYISYSSYSTRGFTYQQLSKLVWIELSDKPLSISELIVTANRWKQDKIKVPHRVENIAIRNVDLLAPQTAADLLESSGYVFVQKSQFAGGSPQLRGFGTNRVMIVVDGIRMNNAIFRSGNLQNVISLDASSLEEAEVLFGPGAVMYGSDAIGGVMNFTTKVAKFSPDSSQTLFETNVFSRYASSSNEFTTHLDINIGKEKWAFLSAVTYSIFDDLKTGEFGNSAFLRPSYQTIIDGTDSTIVNPDPTSQISSAYSQLNLLQKISFRPNKKWLFEYGFVHGVSSDVSRYDRLTLDINQDGMLDNAEWYYGPQKWTMSRLSVVHSPIKKRLYDQLNWTVAYQKFKESRNDRKTDSSSIRRQFEEVDAFSVNMDFEKDFGKRTTLFYGFEGVANMVGSEAFRESDSNGEKININPRYPDGSIWQTYGLYSNLKHYLTDQWIFNTGVRYTIYSIQADFDTSLFAYPVNSTSVLNGALNGSMGLVYNPSERSQIYLNLSTGFRAPNIDDLGKIFDSEPGSVVVPNVELKPEYAYNAEIGFIKAIKNRIKFDGAVYYTYLKDALARGNFTFNGEDSIMYEGIMSRVQAVQNISNAFVYGVQGGIELVIGKGLSLKSVISYQKGSEYNVDSAQYYPKPHVAPLFGKTTLKYKIRHLAVELYCVYHAKVTYKELPLIERSDYVYALDANGLPFSPSWYTLNIKGSYFLNQHLSVNAGIENITNQLYRTSGSGISASGRNFIISLKGSF